MVAWHYFIIKRKYRKSKECSYLVKIGSMKLETPVNPHTTVFCLCGKVLHFSCDTSLRASSIVTSLQGHPETAARMFQTSLLFSSATKTTNVSASVCCVIYLDSRVITELCTCKLSYFYPTALTFPHLTDGKL